MKDIFNDILNEIERAEKLHPDWPSNIVYASAIVAEEAGELVRSCLQHEFEKSPCLEDIKTEAIQTAAVAIRFLINFKNRKTIKTDLIGFDSKEEFIEVLDAIINKLREKKTTIDIKNTSLSRGFKEINLIHPKWQNFVPDGSEHYELDFVLYSNEHKKSMRVK
ncbi:MAG: hypothetical protein ACTSYH_03645 [Candidatus Heimdallarchaeaceae archaeon]